MTDRPVTTPRTIFWATVAVVLLLALWLASDAVLIIFAGLLFAAGLDAIAGLLCRTTRAGRAIGVTAAVTLFTLIIGGLIAWAGTAIASQFTELLSVVTLQIARFGEAAGEMIKSIDPAADEQIIRRLLPDVSAAFGQASNTVFLFLGALGNTFVIFFLGVFFAADPESYRTAAVSLAPPARRERLADVMGKAAATLKRWLIGQGVTMSVILVVTWLALLVVGYPYAFPLGLQAGLLAFVPTIGPLIAGMVIVLVGFSEGMTMALIGLGLYLAIQLLESNLLAPLVQERAIDLPPAATLGFQLVMGALFGLLGLALAVPIAAVAMVFVRELWVEDTLGGPWRGGAG